MSAQKVGKLKFVERLAFGVGALPEVANSIVAAFLTMYYTDNIGLAAGMVGTMFFISKLFDGISDLLAGTLIDRTKTRWGKARPWLLWLAVPTGLALALIFFIPQNGSQTMKLIYAFVTYNLYTTIMFTITGIARNALMPLMTQDMKERNILSTFGMFFVVGGIAAGCSFTFPLIFALGGDIRAWRILFSIYGLIVTLGLLFSFFFSREYVTSVESTQNEEAEKIGFAEGLKLFVKNKYLLFALAMTFLVQIYQQIPSGAGTYFFTYTFKNPLLMSTTGMVNLIATIIGIGVISGVGLTKFGKRKCFYIGTAVQFVAMILRGISGLTLSAPLLYVSAILSGLFMGLMSVPAATLVADGIDYGEYIQNKRIEGIGSSINSFSSKIGAGIGAAMTGWILAATGFVANATQNAATNMGIVSLYSFAPAVILIIMIILFKACYHYDEIADDVVKELNRRKQENK